MKLEEVNNTNQRGSQISSLQRWSPVTVKCSPQYLGAMAKFHTYSFGNIMLIARQKPDATNVAGIRTWNSLGRFVKRGEKGILILAPMIGKKRRTERRNHNETTEIERPQARLVRISSCLCLRQIIS